MKEKILKKEQVALYIRYDVENTENWGEKEEKLKEYCEKNNYDIVKIYRDTDVKCEWYYSITILNIIKNIAGLNFEWDKLIVYDMYELNVNIYKINGFYEMLDDHDIGIETLRQGILGEDFLFNLTIHENVHCKKELTKVRDLEEEIPF